MRKTFLSFGVGLFWALAITPLTMAQIQVDGLAVEHAINPLGIDAQPPRLSWQLGSPKNDQFQSASQVLVASSKDLLLEGKADLWDSGKVKSSQSIYVPYAGKALVSGQECYWKVRVWNQKGVESEWSAPGFWSMGILRPEDWKGKWIGYNPQAKRRLPDKGVLSKMNWDDTNWIWTGEGDATKEAPAGRRYFKFNFDLLKDKKPLKAYLRITADDQYRIFFNGQGVERTNGDDWRKPVEVELAANDLRDGRINAAIEVFNVKKGSAGLACKIAVEYVDGTIQVVSADETNATWTTEVSEDARRDWMSLAPKELKMNPVKVTGPVGIEPWGKPEYGFLPGFEQTAPNALLRKDFTLKKPVRRATLYSSGLGCSEIFLNGKRVGDEVLDPAHTQYNETVLYTTRDLTGLLQQGKNALGAMLGNGWYNMTTRTIWLCEKATWRDRPKLLAMVRVEYADGTSEDIVSDETWRATTSPVLADSIHNGEYYDAREEKPGWTENSYDDKKWADAEIMAAPKGKLCAQAIAPIKIEETLKATRILEPRPGVFVFDLGKNISGHAKLKVQGPTGQEVRLIYGEKLMEDNTVDRHLNGLTWGGSFQEDAYVLKGQGLEEWEPRFVYHGFRYVEVRGFPGKPTLDTLEGRFVHTSFPNAGEFSSSNSLINSVQDATRRGYKGNFVGFPLDCPTREKKGWLGDAHLPVEAGMWNFDNTAGYMNWLRDIRGNQDASGKLKQVAPTGGWGVDDPDWTVAIIVIPWSVYLYSADQTILADNYEMMKRWIAYQEKENPDHILKYGCGDWVVPFKRTSHVVSSTCYYYSGVLKLAQIADVLGHPDDAKYYRALADKIRAAFNTLFVKPDGTIDNRAFAGRTKGPGGAEADPVTQTAQAMALYHGLISPEQQPAVFGKLVELIHNANDTQDVGYLGAKALWRVLSDHGRQDLAWKLATNTSMPSYGFWVSEGFSTLNEMWQGDRTGGRGGSNNHIAFGDISAWYYQYLAGLNPVWGEPGFKETVIRPMPVAALGSVSAWHNSPYGPISSSWTLKGSPKGTVFELETGIPVNTTAVVHVPTASGEVTVNGKPLEKIPGLSVVSKNKNEIVVKVGSGQYRFETLWSAPQS